MKFKLAFVFLLVCKSLFAQNIDPEKLDHYFNTLETRNLGVGTVSIFKNGKEVYHRNFGQQPQRDTIAGSDYKYHVGSVTKMATAVLLFKLVEKGQLSLAEKLADYYPQIPNAEKISLQNMMEHSSGLGSYVVKDGDIWVTGKVTEQQILELIIKQGVKFQPGEKVAYSNSAYYLLTKILEQKYQQPYDKLVDSLIARPLKLKSFASIKSNPANVLKPYQFKNNRWEDITELDFLNVIGVGDLVATSRELNLFIEALFHQKLVNKESLALMLPLPGKEWGKGLAEWNFDGISYYGHGGDAIGSHAVLIHNEATHISIAYNTNMQRIPKEEVIKNIVYLIYGKPFTFPEVK